LDINFEQFWYHKNRLKIHLKITGSKWCSNLLHIKNLIYFNYNIHNLIILYINSLRPSVCDGAFGGWGKRGCRWSSGRPLCNCFRQLLLLLLLFHSHDVSVMVAAARWCKQQQHQQQQQQEAAAGIHTAAEQD
jgi:hypothetical protein